MATAIATQAAVLTAKETAIVDIGAWTARGEQDKLGAAPGRTYSRCLMTIAQSFNSRRTWRLASSVSIFTPGM